MLIVAQLLLIGFQSQLAISQLCRIYVEQEFNCRVKVPSKESLTFGSKDIVTSKIYNKEVLPSWIKYNSVGHFIYGKAPSQNELLHNSIPNILPVNISFNGGKGREILQTVVVKVKVPSGNRVPVSSFVDIFVPPIRFDPGADYVNDYMFRIPSNLFYDHDNNSSRFSIVGPDFFNFSQTSMMIYANRVSRSEVLSFLNGTLLHRDSEYMGYINVTLTASDPVLASAVKTVTIPIIFLSDTSSSISNFHKTANTSFTIKSGSPFSLDLNGFLNKHLEIAKIKFFCYPLGKFRNYSISIVESNSSLVFYPFNKDIGDWILYISLSESSFLQFYISVIFDLSSIYLDRNEFQSFGGRIIDNYFLGSLNKNVEGIIPALRISSQNSTGNLIFKYFIPMSIFSNFYAFGTPASIIESITSDIVNLQVHTFDGKSRSSFLLLVGSVATNSTSQRLVLTICLADSAKQPKTRSFSFFLDLIMNDKLLPKMKGGLASYKTTTTVGFDFSWSIPNDLFDHEYLNFSLSSIPSSRWLNINNTERSFHGIPKASENITVIVLAKDKFESTVFFQLFINVLPNNISPGGGSENDGKSEGFNWPLFVSLLSISIIIIMVVLIKLVHRPNPAINDCSVNSDTLDDFLQEESKPSNEALNLKHLDESYPSYRSFDEIPQSSIDHSYQLNDDEVVVVKAEVGKAFHFVYPALRLMKSLGFSKELSIEEETESETKMDEDKHLSDVTSYIRNAPKGYDLQDEVLNSRLSFLSCTDSSHRSIIENKVKSYFNDDLESPETQDLSPSCKISDDGDYVRFNARLWRTKEPLPPWLHFNPGKCSFFGIPYVSDVGEIEIEIVAGRWKSDEKEESADLICSKEWFILNISNSFKQEVTFS